MSAKTIRLHNLLPREKYEEAWGLAEGNFQIVEEMMFVALRGAYHFELPDLQKDEIREKIPNLRDYVSMLRLVIGVAEVYILTGQ